MRKRFFTITMIAALSSSMLFTSCIGSFGLSSKFLSWNQSIDSKFVNAIIFFLLTPAYAITLTVDALVLNSIEFWTGSNPMQAGIVTKVKGEDGKVYTVETLKDGYKIENEEGKLAYFVYNFDTDVWSSVVDGVETKLVKMNKDNFATVFMPNGEEKEVELSQDGVLAFEQMMDNETYLAAY